MESPDPEKRKIEEGYAKLEQDMLSEHNLQKIEQEGKRASSTLLNDEFGHYNLKGTGLLSDSNLFELEKSPSKKSYHTFINKTPSLPLTGSYVEGTPDGLPNSREVSDAELQPFKARLNNRPAPFKPGKASFLS